MVTARVFFFYLLEATWKHKTHHCLCARGWFFSGQIYMRLYDTTALTFRECVCLCRSVITQFGEILWWSCESCNFRGMKGRRGRVFLSVTLVTCHNDKKVFQFLNLSHFLSLTSGKDSVKVVLVASSGSIDINAISGDHFYSTRSSSLSKPGAYFTHNATWPPKVWSEIPVCFASGG